MLSNVFPVIIISSYTWRRQIPLDSDTLLVIPFALGIAVDDTIHFLTHFRQMLAGGATINEATDMSLKNVGPAMISITIVLSCGFAILLVSSYIPLTNFGFLSALAILSTLSADLFLLSRLLKSSFHKAPSLLAGGILGTISVSSAAPPLVATPSAQEIAYQMLNRKDGSSLYSQTLLISCNYQEKKPGKRSCSSGTRKKTFHSLSKDIADAGVASKSLSVLLEPSTEKGVTFLQEDFQDSKQSSQQWIYMPALKKMKTIVSADNSGPKTGTLFGSEIAYEDIERKHLDDFTYQLAGEAEEVGRKAWILEMTPKQNYRPRTSYWLTKAWVDQETFIPLKLELYGKNNLLKKTIFARKIEQINGVWLALQQIVVNHENQRMSMLQMQNPKVNIKLSDALFSTRALTDADFRNQQLKDVTQ